MSEPLKFGLLAAIIVMGLLTISISFFMENEDSKHRNGDDSYLRRIAAGSGLATLALVSLTLFLRAIT